MTIWLSEWALALLRTLTYDEWLAMLSRHGVEPDFGGSGEIRTHGGREPSPVFKTGALNRSATLPFS